MPRWAKEYPYLLPYIAVVATLELIVMILQSAGII